MNKIRRLILPPAREAKFRAVIARRQPTLAVCLENVFDPHNLAAVLRTCDSVGVMDVYVLQTEESLRKPLVLGKKSSGGSRKWVDVHLHTDVESCFSALRARYGRILGTALGKSSTGLYQLDLAQPVALVFGNEHRGLSPEASAACDGHFMIPQMGMPESLNLSVACAVSLYEAHRQRAAAGMYDVPQLSPEEAPRPVYAVPGVFRFAQRVVGSFTGRLVTSGLASALHGFRGATGGGLHRPGVKKIQTAAAWAASLPTDCMSERFFRTIQEQFIPKLSLGKISNGGH